VSLHRCLCPSESSPTWLPVSSSACCSSLVWSRWCRCFSFSSQGKMSLPQVDRVSAQFVQWSSGVLGSGYTVCSGFKNWVGPWWPYLVWRLLLRSHRFSMALAPRRWAGETMSRTCVRFVVMPYFIRVLFVTWVYCIRCNAIHPFLKKKKRKVRILVIAPSRFTRLLYVMCGNYQIEHIHGRCMCFMVGSKL